jgi:8-oxo-dGTP pyrophosphatase MutT (NUDIX family)
MELYDINKNSVFLISAKAFIINRNNQLLVLKMASGKWGLPGGLVEFNESIQEGLTREVKEETGLRIKIGRLLMAGEAYNKNFILRDKRVVHVHFVGLMYLCEPLTQNISLSDEHDDYFWAMESDLPKYEFQPEHLGKIISEQLSNLVSGQLNPDVSTPPRRQAC